MKKIGKEDIQNDGKVKRQNVDEKKHVDIRANKKQALGRTFIHN